jgi:IS30 family transposase
VLSNTLVRQVKIILKSRILSKQKCRIATNCLATIATRIERNQKRCFSTEETERMIEDYTKNKLTVYQLAEKYGCHRNTVSRHLRKNDVEVAVAKLGDNEVAEAARLYESGLSLRDIEKKMGACKTTIGRALAKAGVVLQPARRVSYKS